jgi:hypothetical protein
VCLTVCLNFLRGDGEILVTPRSKSMKLIFLSLVLFIIFYNLLSITYRKLRINKAA